MYSFRGNLSRLWDYIKTYKFRFFLSLFLGLLTIVNMTLNPIFLGLAITELTQNIMDMARGVPGAGVNFAYIGWVALVIVVNSTLRSLAAYFSNFLMAGVVQNSMFSLRKDISEKTNRIPVSYFDSHYLGDVLSRTTNDVDSVANAFQQAVIPGWTSFLSVVLSVITMFLLDWKLALKVAGAIVLTIITIRLITKKSQPIFNKQQGTLGELFGFAQEQLSGFTEIKAYNKEDESIESFKRINQDLYDYGSSSAFLSSILQPISNGIFNFTYVAILILGGINVLRGFFTVGNLQAFLTYVSSVSQPINMITQFVGQIQAANAAASRIFAYLDEEEEYQRPVTSALPKVVKGHVEFKNVKFGYSEDNILMEDVSFEVMPGQMAAIVGPTGAGKTTLINLLMRFYDVLDGEIKVDGVNIQDISREELRQHMGMVLQDAWLYSGSIMENIRFGNLEAQDYEVKDAAQAANVDQFINTLPGTYHMHINEDADNISQGQKQLMTIARALISDPDILILDEATSSVDTRLEHLIQSAMDRIMEDRTSFVIAHRLSTIKDADIILVMEDGNIIEKGNHQELMEEEGFYADLYNSQFNQEPPADIHMSY